jgi:hypothetical protein
MSEKTILQQPKTCPDKPGKWWFQGKATTRSGRLETVVRVQNRPFTVVQSDHNLILADPDSHRHYKVDEFVGTWVEETTG